MSQIDLRQHLCDVPLLMCPESLRALMNSQQFQVPDMTLDAERAMFGYEFGDRDRQQKPYRMVEGAAIIPITGALLHRVGFSGWGITGYNYIRKMFDTALADPDVKGIVFDVNSGGGQVDGAFDLADHIYANRGKKPSTAIVDSHAYSAAYLLASSAGSISVPNTGGTGSIGVVTMHVDWSKALSDYGMAITFIHAGKHKVDGNPYQSLPGDVKDRIQSRIDGTYDLFVAAVARNRGMTDKAVRKTEALTFSAEDSVQLGLADSVSSPDEALSKFIGLIRSVKQEGSMSATNQNPVVGQQATTQGETFTKADLEQAKAEGYEQGVAAERKRFVDVLDSEHFADHAKTAKLMLSNGKLSAEEINNMLASLPKVVQSASNAFATAMDVTGNPDVGADAPADKQEDSTKRILGNYVVASGRKAVN